MDKKYFFLFIYAIIPQEFFLTLGIYNLLKIGKLLDMFIFFYRLSDALGDITWIKRLNSSKAFSMS